MPPRRALSRQGDLFKLSGDTFTIKEQLKQLGARFDGAQKCWFLPADESLFGKLEFLGFLIPLDSNKTPAPHIASERAEIAALETDPQPDATPDVFSVGQFSAFVENMFRRYLSFDFWIVGEISSLKSSSGHCYFDLVEPEQERALQTGRAASVSCCLWAGKIRQLAEKMTNFPMADGIKVKLKVHCDLRKEGTRLSLIVDDIDPQFTLGDLALQRQNIVRELKRRGLYDRQRRFLSWPHFPMRIALLTAQGSRAESDFLDELRISGLAFKVTLFDCHMQGERVEDDITQALSLITQDHASHFDCVVITRGGGSRLDLRWFDNLEIGKSIAYCPLPVLTAIGHFDDVSVADEVACVAEKTPTGAARFLTQSVAQGFERMIQQLERSAQSVRARLRREGSWLEKTELMLERTAQRRIERGKDQLSESLRALRLVQNTAAQPLRMGYSLLRTPDGQTLCADDFLTSDRPQCADVELYSRRRQTAVVVRVQVTSVQQRQNDEPHVQHENSAETTNQRDA